MCLTTTIIGSLPRLHEELKASIRFAVELQVKTGIDIISDGEQRTDMISYLSNSMHGVELNEKIRIVGKIRPIENTDESFKIADFLEARNYVKEKGYGNRIKIGLTGPVTFGFSVAMYSAGPYGNIRNRELYNDVAVAVNKVAKQIQYYDGLVQIDEPGVNAGFLNPSLIEEPLSIATDGLDPKLTSIHACGKLSLNVLKTLSRIKNISVISLEFADSPGNIDILPLGITAEASKKIGVGCMKVNVLSPNDLTPIEEAVETVKKIMSGIGKESVAYMHPDCGLRRTKPDLATTILKNLKGASRHFC